MATYNRAHFIVETLKSIQNQNFEHWECFIIDDGGTDNTEEVIEPIIENDARFNFIKRKDAHAKGLPGCRNQGLDLARGEYIIFFDDDDIVHPDNLKICLNVIESQNIDFCHYQKQSFENQKPIIANIPITIVKSIGKEDIKDVITQKIGLASCTVLWKKKCFDNIRFNESLFFAEEWECYSKIISEDYKGVIISNTLYFNRKHTNSNTGEFYNDNPIRRESYAKAILFVVQNLKEKGLLSSSLKRYFITFSMDFKEYLLFETLLNEFEMNRFEKMKWYLYFYSYSIRLPIFKVKKALLKPI